MSNARKVATVVLALAGCAVIALVAWRWFSGAADRHADDVRDSVAELPAVVSIGGGEVPEVLVDPGATTDEVATVLDEAVRYREAVSDAEIASAVDVRLGDALVRIKSGGTPVDPALLVAAGSWASPDDALVQIVAEDGGIRLSATSSDMVSITTLDWLVQRAVGLEPDLRATVGQLVATNDNGTISRLFGDASSDLTASTPLVAALTDLADLDPAVTVSAPELGFVEIETDVDQVVAVQERAAETLRDYPGVEVMVSSTEG